MLASSAASHLPPCWLLHSSGAPRPTRTFFCNADGDSCFNHTATSRLSFTSARQRCAAQSGDLVQYTRMQKQRDVEAYFSSRGTLAADMYWHGILREGAGGPILFIDGSPAPESVSNDNPYAHWDFNYLKTASQPAHLCAIAASDTSYDLFLGSLAQVNDSRYYTRQAGNMDRKYGWRLQPCPSLLAYICEIPPSMFGCSPPPLPPPSPPSPPPPPAPPAPPTCAPAYNKTFFCDASSSSCYALHSATPLSHATARSACTSRGGVLVRYESAPEQLEVERWVAQPRSLCLCCWAGRAHASIQINKQ